MPRSPITWPEGKKFAFTVFDDPDSQTLGQSSLLYAFLRDLGLRTTKGVWTAGPPRPDDARSQNCLNPAYRAHLSELQAQGFEIGFHGAALASSPRAETCEALEHFKDYFGHYPLTMSNHFDNAEAVYWGDKRVSGPARLLYRLATLNRRGGRYSGETPGSGYFWGDLCRERIAYCRNFVFSSINTLSACPWMPYHDPLRPLVNAWYASSEGASAARFVATIAEPQQDRLEAEGGACIMYTHFGKGFVEDGRILPRFAELMRRLAAKDGWFVPVSTLLAHLEAVRGKHILSPSERRRLEWRWLSEKFLQGTS